MRISGGLARGIELSVPRGDAVRPATDGMRQAVFSSLGARVAGARFVDLFAGSGAYGAMPSPLGFKLPRSDVRPIWLRIKRTSGLVRLMSDGGTTR